NNFLEEVAKFRAARTLWAKLIRERYNPQNPKSLLLRFHTQTGGSTLTAQQPENNIVRVALQALSAVLGGTQSLHTNGMDEALALPTEKAVQIALRTQQIIAHETGVADTVDPLAGSYAIEALTLELMQRAEDYITTIDEMGGALAALEAGFINREIETAAYEYQKAVQDGGEIIVGVNRYQVDEEIKPELLRVDPAIEAAQHAKLRDLRENRDNDRVNELRGRIGDAARGTDNLMPLFVEAVENDVTLGEICHTLRDVFGEYRPPTMI
ncbi:MAG: methylmalonyl-CoA mutase family protein, partial [Chloroflexota bacterium]